MVPNWSVGKAQMERTGLIKSSEIFANGTEIVDVVEEHKVVQIEIKEELYTQPNYAKHGRDAMGRFIVEDGLSRMIPKPKLNAKEKRQRLRLELLNRPSGTQASQAQISTRFAIISSKGDLYLRRSRS